MLQHIRALMPAIIIALAILLGTAISVQLEDSGWWVMVGPVILAGAMVLASVVDQQNRGAGGRRVRVAAVTAGIYLLAAGIICLRNPGGVAQVVPLLGAGAVVLMGSWGTQAQANREDERCH